MANFSGLPVNTPIKAKNDPNSSIYPKNVQHANPINLSVYVNEGKQL